MNTHRTDPTPLRGMPSVAGYVEWTVKLEEPKDRTDYSNVTMLKEIYQKIR